MQVLFVTPSRRTIVVILGRPWVYPALVSHGQTQIPTIKSKCEICALLQSKHTLSSHLSGCGINKKSLSWLKPTRRLFDKMWKWDYRWLSFYCDSEVVCSAEQFWQLLGDELPVYCDSSQRTICHSNFIIVFLHTLTTDAETGGKEVSLARGIGLTRLMVT